MEQDPNHASINANSNTNTGSYFGPVSRWRILGGRPSTGTLRPIVRMPVHAPILPS